MYEGGDRMREDGKALFSSIFSNIFTYLMIIGEAVGGDERIRDGPVVYYEEYDGGHFGCERRFDYSIPMLANALHTHERNTSILE